MLETTIELLTEGLIEESFKNKKNNKESKFVISKIELYRFCIKLVKLILKVENMEEK